jgi:RHS repeat-associated protein
MSDEPTSVRPELLQTFASTSQRVESSLDTRISAARRAVSTFLAGTDAGLATAQPDLVEGELTDIAERLRDTRRFATLLREAVLAADVQGGGGPVTLTSAQLMAGLSDSARSEFELLLQPTPLSPIDPPTVGTIPEDSGLVDDPVCTATGHFLEDELDLVVPDRVLALGWQRRYSSRQLDVNAHGPGWWTWADVECRDEGDAVVVVCPDGRHLRFARPAAGGASQAEDVDVSLQVTGAGAFVVRWGLRHRAGPQSWHFGPEGRPHLVDSALAGRTMLVHDERGRLVSMEHEGGRALRVEWDDDRIAAVRDDHGRRACYRYVDGHLVEVVRASGGRTYATDVQGRIVEVVDADGVTLARNRYDADGRVVRQVAPTGRVTVFRYEPGRRTAVLDGAGDLIALYVHDHRGRVEAMVSPHGAELTRSFDRDGRVSSLLAQDGSGFTSEGSAGPHGTLHVRHHDGRVEQLDHDHLGRVVRHELVGAGATSFEYEGDSICPSAVTSPTGARRTMTWRDGGVLVGATDADGVTVTLDVDGDGMPTAARNGAGHTVAVERAPAGAPTRIELPDGGTVTADIDEAGRVRRIVGPDGSEASLEHSRAGRLRSVTDGDGNRVSFHHGAHGFLERAIDELGRTMVVDIDQWGRPRALGADGEPGWTFQWSALGVLTAVTTPAGASWHVELDDHHRAVRTIDPDDRSEVLERDDAGRLVAVRHPGGTVEAGFDPAGNVDVLDAVPGGRTSVRHDHDGRVVEVTDADGVRTVTAHTPAGRIARQQVGDDEAVTYEHDATGEVVAVAQDGATWRIDRDWRGETTAIASPTGRQVRVQRDPVGRPTAIDRAGVEERWTYDAQGRVVSHHRPTGTTVRIDRDAVGRVVAVDGPGGRAELTHDPAAGTTVTVDATGARTRVASDPDGFVRERVDPLGRKTTFERAPGGGIQALVAPDGTRLGFEHDDAGRITAAYDDGTALARYRYEGGQLVDVEEPATGRRTTFDLSAAGRVQGWRDEEARHVAITRDQAGRVVSRHGDLLPSATWSHEPRARRGEVDGRATAIELDLDGVVAALRVGVASLELTRAETGEVGSARWQDDSGEHRLVLERDAAGRVLAAVLDGERATYAYDAADRLVTWTRGDVRTEWEHDVAGRLVVEREVQGDSSRERCFGYDAAHQLVTVVDADGTTDISYDDAGRRIAEHRPDGSVRRFEWDALGRLRAVVDGDRRTDVDIDCFGRLRRVGATELGWDLSTGVPELASVGGDAVVTVGGRAVGVGDRLAVAQLVGSVAQGVHPGGVAPADGTVSLTCGVPGGIGFAGLIWLGDRILDPATGQFLSPDPLAATIGSPTQSFPYAYADGDPVNRADPTGRNGQPISIQDFEDARQRSMDWQWGNIATVAAVVGGVALAATGVGLVGLVVGGAIIGGAQAGAMSYQETGSVNWREVGVGAAFGGLTGAVGFGTAKHLTPMINGRLAASTPLVQRASSSLGGRMVTGGATAAVTELPLHAGHELVDSTLDGRSFSGTNVLTNTGLSFTTGSLVDPTRAVADNIRGHFSGGGSATPPPSILDVDAPVLSPMPQTPIDPVPRPALPAPEPRLALPAPAPRLALPAPAPPSSLITPTPTLSLPSPPAGFVTHPSGMYVPQ